MSTALKKYEPQEFAALDPQSPAKRAFEANIGEEGFSMSDLIRVKMPRGTWLPVRYCTLGSLLALQHRSCKQAHMCLLLLPGALAPTYPRFLGEHQTQGQESLLHTLRRRT